VVDCKSLCISIALKGVVSLVTDQYRVYISDSMDNAFKFDEKSGGLCSEEDYPYTAKQGPSCLTNCTDVPGSIVKDFVDVPPSKEKALLAAIAMQPVSVALQADQVCKVYSGLFCCVIVVNATSYQRILQCLSVCVPVLQERCFGR